MRQIEKEMLRAINERETKTLGNTFVRFDADDNVSAVFLHGNHIADFWHPLEWNAGGIEPNLDTLAEWPTPTTKSRLRALGVNVTQKAGVVAIDGEVVCHV